MKLIFQFFGIFLFFYKSITYILYILHVALLLLYYCIWFYIYVCNSIFSVSCQLRINRQRLESTLPQNWHTCSEAVKQKSLSFFFIPCASHTQNIQLEGSYSMLPQTHASIQPHMQLTRECLISSLKQFPRDTNRKRGC